MLQALWQTSKSLVGNTFTAKNEKKWVEAIVINIFTCRSKDWWCGELQDAWGIATGFQVHGQ